MGIYRGYSWKFYTNILNQVKKRFPNGVPLLDPVKDMKIGDKEFKEVIKSLLSLPKLSFCPFWQKVKVIDLCQIFCPKALEH